MISISELRCVMVRFLRRDKQKDSGSVEELKTLYVHNRIKNKMCGS